jgi:kynurenine formamidase
VKSNPNYALQVTDIEAWENKHGRIPEGSVVFVRSDWSKAWPDPKLATLKEFPGVGWRPSSFCISNARFCFMDTSHSTPIQLRTSKARTG